MVYVGAEPHIALTSSHVHHSDVPNAYFFIQVLALSHRAQVLILELSRVTLCK